jgi:hypothetical protein
MFRFAIRPWFQFRLRTLLLAMFVASLVFSWWCYRMQRHERIEDAVRLLTLSPKLEDKAFDPIALVRAVNCLCALGKGEAIEALRRYVTRNSKAGHQDDALRLFLVMPLAFQPIDPEDGRSFGIFCDESECGTIVTGISQVQVFLKDDLPLQIRYTGARVTPREDWMKVIQWAEQQGRLRGSPLRPPDDPVTVAEEMSSHYPSATSDSFEIQFQAQATRAIAHLIQPVTMPEPSAAALAEFPGTPTLIPFSELSLWWTQPETEPDWSHLKSEWRRLGIRWSEQKQAYVATHSTN